MLLTTMEMRSVLNTLLSRSSSVSNKSLIHLFALAFCLMLTGCNGCSNKQSQGSRAESPINPRVEEVDKKVVEGARKDSAASITTLRRLWPITSPTGWNTRSATTVCSSSRRCPAHSTSCSPATGT